MGSGSVACESACAFHVQYFEYKLCMQAAAAIEAGPTLYLRYRTFRVNSRVDIVSRDRRFEAAAQRCCSCWLQAVHTNLRDRPFSGVKMVQIRHNASSDRELCVCGDGDRGSVCKSRPRLTAARGSKSRLRIARSRLQTTTVYTVSDRLDLGACSPVAETVLCVRMSPSIKSDCDPWQRRGAYCCLGAARWVGQGDMHSAEEHPSLRGRRRNLARSFSAQQRSATLSVQGVDRPAARERRSVADSPAPGSQCEERQSRSGQRKLRQCAAWRDERGWVEAGDAVWKIRPACRPASKGREMAWP